MKNYQKRIGDGKLPNIYYVFHYDEKAVIDENGEWDFPDTTQEVEGGYLGQFKSYQKALECVDDKAYLDHVIIEDRLSGVVFEQVCKVCKCCGHETYDTIEDIQFTKDQLGNDFI